ncbi:hypothetical protein Ga0123462_1235 [Mariprofundus ferrinatatus]|uniref:DUF4911 domain-containing protein n=1 Tax=Mariprofundus ferrinatatus TaxID=1921087 RepID=A0A2K8L772_9PROT|nr:DUF4911 domain-containing protein [Mariprofundus ferrinatatus]ATX82099.1 hypothetical protein Ga0123462_1235 [Mariprofundus ferrinatatus]
MASEDTVIVEVELPPGNSFRFQTLLEGEAGLAVARCFDPEHKKQQLWTTPSQRDDLLAWLATLPESLEVMVCGEWIWSDGSADNKHR